MVFIIWGYKNVFQPVANGGTRLLEQGAPTHCPARGCGALNKCRVFVLQRHCHMYWIPCFPVGEEHFVVKCLACQVQFDLDQYKAYQRRLTGAGVAASSMQERDGGSSVAADIKIRQLMEQGRYDAAGMLSAEILKHCPSSDSKNCLKYLTLFNVALNGSGFTNFSDQVANEIVRLWRQQPVSERPVEAAFARVLLIKGLDPYHVEAKQFYERQADKSNAYLMLYQVRANPIGALATGDNKERLFRLIQYKTDQQYELIEVFGSFITNPVLSYAKDELGMDNAPPDIRKVASDVAALLMGERPAATSPSCKHLQVLDDGRAGFSFYGIADRADPQQALTLKNAVAMADWRVIRDFFATLPKEERSFWIGTVQTYIEQTWSSSAAQVFDAEGGGAMIMSPMLNGWLAAEPQNVDCRLIRLETYAAWAWHVRTGGLARNVSKERFAMFHQRLKEAAQELERARAICPADDPLLYEAANPILLGLTSLKHPGLMTMEEARAAVACSQDPLHYGFHLSALQYHCQKWHGSHDQMFDYVKSVTQQLPHGHPLWVLVPMAHYERTLIDPSANGGKYWKSPDVLQQLVGAYYRSFPNEKLVSAETPIHLEDGNPNTSKERFARSYFAFCFLQAQQWKLARRQFVVLGKRPHQRPWHSISTYKYYAGLLGFDTQECSEEERDDNNPTDIPIAYADAIPVAATVPATDEGSGEVIVAADVKPLPLDHEDGNGIFQEATSEQVRLVPEIV